MELRHLEYFVAVAEERNFTRAATRLHVVQSAVSAAVKSLERELGAPLLERTSKRVDLTDAGRALLPRARAAIDAVRDARDAVHEVSSGLRGTLRIGTMISVGLVDMAALLGRFHREHPEVDVQLATAAAWYGRAGLVDELTAGRLDLAFVSLPGDVPDGVRLRRLASAPLDLVVPAGHPLAARGEVPIAELADRSFIDFPAGYGNRVVADRAFAAAGLRRRVAIEITDIAAGADFVRHGLGIALLPRFVIVPDPELAVLAVTGADLSWPMSLATPADRSLSAAARALLGLIEGGVGAG